MNKKLKKIDIFGYPIQLNFNQKGEKHNTLMGSLLTIVYYAFIMGYTIYCFYKLVFHLQDSDNLVTTSLNLGQLGNVSYDSTSLTLFAMIKGKNLDSSLSELSRFIDIYFTN